MKGSDTARGLAAFLAGSPSCFHAVANMRDELLKNGFTELQENQKWQLRPGGKYFVTRNGSALIAFTIPDEDFTAFRIIASHSDSPSFKIKENPELETDGHYIRLNTERYGGMLCAPWFDRPLSVAGRVIVKDPADDTFHTKLVNIDRDLLLIPSLAIHMNREANDGYKYDMKKDLLPLYGTMSGKDTFMKTVAEAAGVNETEILGHDLFLYNPRSWGTTSSSTTGKRPASGARPGSSSPAAGWTTCSAPTPPFAGSSPERKKHMPPSTACWTTKKPAARQNRALPPPSCQIRWSGSAAAWALAARTTSSACRKASCSPQTTPTPYTRTTRTRPIRPTGPISTKASC